MALTEEEFEARRAAKKEAAEKARAAQLPIDRENIAELEDEHGYELDISLSVRHVVAGHPVLLGVRAPNEGEYKRLIQSINRAGNADAKLAAIEQLARTCWAYPADDASRKAIMAANPALLAQVGTLANKLAELRSADEGKD
jgi:hypothetical protein